METGDLWFDDIKMQQGVTSAYRRRFLNGMVLVNPDTYPVTLNLGGSYRKIWDDNTFCPNYSYASDAARTVTQVTIPGWDAVFLLNPNYTPYDGPPRVTGRRTTP